MATFIENGKKIVAIGRNYVVHLKKNDPFPKEPFFFLKPTSSYLPSGGKLEIPQGIIANHEVELGVVIGKRGRDISQADAESYILGYTLAVDMTAHNLLDRTKKLALPWTAAKGFDTFTPIASMIPKTAVQDPHNLKLSLAINGVTKQAGSTGDMIFSIPRLIEHVSSIMTLEEGDVILTGTPGGIGPIVPGDQVDCVLADARGRELIKLDFTAVQRGGGYRFKD